MSAPETDSMSIASLPLVVGGSHAHRPSELELEVMTIFDAYRTRLLGYVSAFGLTGHDGEEVVQEVFLSLFCHLRMGKSRSNLRGWVFRVAHNLALKQRMANRRWLDRVETERDMESVEAATLNPEVQLLADQRQGRLLAVVAALPEQDRLCFSLRAEGLRYREIAEVLGMSLGSVSVSLTRSMARLMRADDV